VPTTASGVWSFDGGQLTFARSTIGLPVHLLHFGPTAARQSTHIALMPTVLEYEEVLIGIPVFERYFSAVAIQSALWCLHAATSSRSRCSQGNCRRNVGNSNSESVIRNRFMRGVSKSAVCKKSVRCVGRESSVQRLGEAKDGHRRTTTQKRVSTPC